MGLGLTSGSGAGDIKPYINYDAKAGRMFRVDRAVGSDGMYATEKTEITNSVQFVADLANIRIGWVNYTSQGPIRKFVTLGEAMPPRPTDMTTDGKPAFKQGFEMDLLLDKASGGGPARVFGSAAGCVIEAVDALHDIYTAAAESKAGKLPIVKVAAVTPIKSGQSTNYKPTFAIVNWIDRPEGLAAQHANGGHGVATGGAPSTGKTPVPPPKAKVAPTQAVADAADFG